ncbi:hypothetical protein G9P44_001916 [Scheffersomyces stipitis]|nr:hypothetical protein G9P44_001916 [Scheffersomyces stipitis]
MDPIEPLTLGDLKAFPLPKYIEALPTANLHEFLGDESLVKGYVKELESYRNHQERILAQLRASQHKLQEQILDDLIHKYRKIVDQIMAQMNRITSLYQEYRNLEMYQYQLLSSNFNRDFLIRTKFGNLISRNNQESIDLVKKFHSSVGEDGDVENKVNDLVTSFRASRREYHLRKEKLNRWNEERVSG